MPSTTKIAIVGYGLVGKRHADVLRTTPEMDIAAIVEPTQSGRADAAPLGVPIFENLEDMFDAMAPDGVVLATPTPLHLE